MKVPKYTNLKRIYIYTSEPFPQGFAATNRIIAYSTGFLIHHKEVFVICLRKTEKKDGINNKEPKGIYRKIPYQYLSKSTVKSASFFGRRLDVILMNCRLFFHSIGRLDRYSLAIFYSTRTSAAIILRITTWLKGCKFIKEESEYPESYLVEKVKLNAFIFKTLHYYLFDGLLLISRNLIEYFKNTKNYRKPILHVPMIVDFERFNLKPVKRKKNIAYCGILNDEKDGTNILLHSFAKANQLHPEYTLSLYGIAASENDWIRYHQIVSDLNLNNKVIFFGKVDIESIPRYLMEASILVLPRPESMQAHLGFPTKLGEYLATGNPVIVTPVGDIPDYLQDGVSAYFVKPNNVDNLFEKLIEAIEKKDLSEKIGSNGKIVAQKYFNNELQSKDIIDFFNLI